MARERKTRGAAICGAGLTIEEGFVVEPTKDWSLDYTDTYRERTRSVSSRADQSVTFETEKSARFSSVSQGLGRRNKLLVQKWVQKLFRD